MKDLKKITNALKKIRLSESERMSARNRLIRFIEDNPLEEKPGFLASFYLRLRRPVLASAMAFGVLLVGTGGVTYASESALPGDFLYSFKVDVVEEVRGAFQFSAEDKAAWDAKRLERRFDEIEKLKDEGKLNTESKLEIKEQMKEHKQEFKDHLEDLKDKGKPDRADEMEIEFKSTFEQEEKLQEEWKPDFEFRPFKEQTENEEDEESEEEMKANFPEL